MSDYASSKHSVRELRDYLRGDVRSGIVPVPEFDVFLQDVAMLFRLRNAAEDRFKSCSHLAKNARGALPLEWGKIGKIFSGTEDAPDENLVSEIAKECLPSVEEILGSLRVVLLRSREKVGIGKVQQIDAHCMQWLVRQPGRDPVEKAGVRQEILAVVRRENFNTLENRVFKDFLARYRPLSQQYLEKNKKFLPGAINVQKVARLEKLCSAGTRLPELSDISAIRDLPSPNYVLQQHRNYSKIWVAYVSIVEWANIEERLWGMRQEVAETLKNLREKQSLFASPRAKFHAQIWFNRLDGRRSLLCTPCWENELLPCDPVAANLAETRGNGHDAVVDLTGREPAKNELLYLVHENAKPCLENPQRQEHPREIEKRVSLREILHEILREKGGNDEYLRDYFEQLRASIGGEKWTILVPDNWTAHQQEKIVRATPTRTFLLWRSVAAIRGVDGQFWGSLAEGDIVAVVDFQTTGTLISKLTLLAREEDCALVPQRSSFARDGADGVPARYKFLRKEAGERNKVCDEIVCFLANDLSRAKKVVVLGCKDEALRLRMRKEFGGENVCFQGDEDDFCKRGGGNCRRGHR